MKKLILIAIAVFSLQTLTAQRPNMGQKGNMMNERMSYMEKLSVEQIANLQTKRMTLQFDLSESQINKINKLNLEVAKKRKEKMTEMKGKGKPGIEDRYNMMIARLDGQIVYKNKLKAILSKEQLEKFERLQARHFGSQGRPVTGESGKFRGM